MRGVSTAIKRIPVPKTLFFLLFFKNPTFFIKLFNDDITSKLQKYGETKLLEIDSTDRWQLFDG